MTRLPRALALVLATASVLGCSASRSESKADTDGAAGAFPQVADMNKKRWANGLEKAAKELGCAQGQLTHESLGSGRFVFRGAGKEVEYALYCSAGSCVWLDDLRTRAAFDLNCPREQLQLTFIDEKTRGVSGCDKRATYLVDVRRHPSGWGTEATWIMNSAAP